MQISNNIQINFGISCSDLCSIVKNYSSVKEKQKLIGNIYKQTVEFIKEGDNFVLNGNENSDINTANAIKSYETAIGNLKFIQNLIDKLIKKLEERVNLLKDRKINELRKIIEEQEN